MLRKLVCSFKRYCLAYTLSILMALLVLGSSGCGQTDNRGLIKVGLVGPFSGRYRALGYEALFAVRLALREWNAQGGVEGYRVLLVAQDDRGRADAGLLQAKKMVMDEDVYGVVGHNLAASLSGGMPVYSDAGMTVLSWGIAELKEEQNEILVQLGPAPATMANAISDFIIQHLDMNMVGVIAGNGAEHSHMAGVLVDTMQAKGLTVTFRGSLPSDQTYYGDVVAELKRENPQVVFFSGGIEEAGSLLLQARQAGVDSRFIVGFESAGADLIRMAGEAARGVYYVSPGRNPGDIEGAETFLEAYQAVSGAPPPDVTAVMAYDATNLLLEAIALSVRQEGTPSRQNVRLALDGIEDYKGVGDNITIAKENGNGENGVYIYIIEGLSYPGKLIYDRIRGGN